MKYIFYYNFPIGRLGIAEDGTGITDIFFPRDNKKLKDSFEEKETELIKMAKVQLDEYFAGTRQEFSIPLSLKGTEFQVKDWEALCTIPYGETRSYKEIAIQIGNPKACRAVGMANNRNPVLIVVPCHRVIGHNGKLVGYGGGLDVKEQLLNLEKNSALAERDAAHFFRKEVEGR